MNARPKKRKILELALLIGAGAGFKPILVLILDNGVNFRLCGRVNLALGGGFGTLVATVSGFVGLGLGKRLCGDCSLAGF